MSLYRRKSEIQAMPSEVPFAMRSSVRSRKFSQFTRNSQDSGANPYRDHFPDGNLLAGSAVVSQPPSPIVAPRTAVGNTEGATEPDSNDANHTRLVISFDFGTTFTGAAFALTDDKIADLKKIRVVTDYGKSMDNSLKIPSVISYSSAINGERQLGADLSPEAIINKNMKLRLDVPRKKIDALELTLEELEGAGNLSIDHVVRSNRDPAYAYRPPITIVTDYLTKVFECAWRTIETRYLYGTIPPPVDVVITVPAGWSYKATNSTFRALKKAGFNEKKIPKLRDMILLSEPEAASYFTVRHLQEGTTEFLKVNEPVILVDAGGGTVDTIAYQIKQLEPYLELVQVSEPTNDKCGAAFIDTNFKRWLFKLIGEERYTKFDPSYSGLRIGAHATESSDMRRLMRQFDEKKRTFSHTSGPIKLDLPGSLSSLTISGVINEGELTMQPGDMRAMFNACVSKIIPLIRDQKKMAESVCKRRVRNLLLVGGFGESPYLRYELEHGLALRGIEMRYPKHMASWTAVVQGGVIYGIERAHHDQLKIMKTSRRDYGIVVDEVGSYMYDEDDWFIHQLTNTAMARGQFTWMVRKGDLMLSEKTEVAAKEFTRTFRASDNRRFDLPIYTYSDEDEDVPDRWATGQNDVKVIGTVRCDITTVARGELQSRKNYDTGESYVLAYLTCKMWTSFNYLEVEVFANDTSVGRTAIIIGDQEILDTRPTRYPRGGSISSFGSRV